MAEFKCYDCGKTVKTGEKFTFTKKGSVHFECFISSRRKEVQPDRQEALRSLTVLLDKELQHLISVLDIREVPESLKETLRLKYKDVEKACGETTRLISDL